MTRVGAVGVTVDDGGKPSPRPYQPPEHLWPATPRGVHRARHALAARLAEWGWSELTDDAGLVLSELMTNAQTHGRMRARKIGTSFLRSTAGVVVEVHDARRELPVLAQADDADEHGRGLAIVEAVTGGQWGVISRQGDPGKVVWGMCALRCGAINSEPGTPG
jgi:serine/threonine-protein kinase RsbW